jgi:hypothetical protein
MSNSGESSKKRVIFGAVSRHELRLDFSIGIPAPGAAED